MFGKHFLIITFMVVFFAAGTASADIIIDDPMGDAPNLGQDIDTLTYYAGPNFGDYYHNWDLRMYEGRDPVDLLNGHSMSDVYGIAINYKQGGTDGSMFPYDPDGLGGIDLLITSYFDDETVHYQGSKLYTWQGSSWSETQFPGIVVPQGDYIIWSVGDSNFEGGAGLGDYIQFYGFTLNLGDPSDVHDVTGPGLAASVPLPAAFWLMASGLAGIAAIRKRHSS